MSNNGKGHDFTGFNALWLYMLHGGGYFATYKQWKHTGAQVNRGAKGISVLRPVFKKEKYTKVDGSEAERDVLVNYAVYTVFSSDDVTGWEAPELPTIDFTPVQAVERLVTATGAEISHTGSKAFYMPSEDRIQMPRPETFFTVEDYYATLLHELAHWSGHKTRLDRDQNTNRFGSNAYAFEELIAETAATFLCARLGINQGMYIRDNHIKYIKGWLEIMRGDSKALSTACSKAQAVTNYLLGFTAEAGS